MKSAEWALLVLAIYLHLHDKPDWKVDYAEQMIYADNVHTLNE